VHALQEVHPWIRWHRQMFDLTSPQKRKPLSSPWKCHSVLNPF
jgi:hypothetical protein